jgi:hypothetical protein
MPGGGHAASSRRDLEVGLTHSFALFIFAWYRRWSGLTIPDCLADGAGLAGQPGEFDTCFQIADNHRVCRDP